MEFVDIIFEPADIFIESFHGFLQRRFSFSYAMNEVDAFLPLKTFQFAAKVL
jgi:hypothetical protein